MANESGDFKVLVVERDPAFSKLIKIFLKTSGFDPVVTHSAIEAKNVFQANPSQFHALVTHVLMESNNGPDFADDLRQSNPNLKVLFTSGESRRELANQRNLEIPERQFIRKPFGQTQIKDKLIELLAE